MKKILSTFVFLIVITIPVYTQDYFAEKIDLPESDLRNFYRIDDGVYRSDQPYNQDFTALEKFGIREILNLRNHHSDEKKARGTSLVLHRLKTRAKNISEEQVTEALQIINDRKGPILIHCWHGSDRTGAVSAMYRIVFQDIPKEEAIRELRDGGFGYHKMYRNIIHMINDADVPEIKRKLGLD